MSTEEIQKIIKFISEAELKSPTSVPLPINKEINLSELAKVNKNQGFVNCGSVQCIPISPPGPHCDEGRYDALLWTLFAQLVANKKFDRWSQAECWYQEYVKTLENTGMRGNQLPWSDREHFSNTVEQLACDYMKTILTVALEKLTESILNALGKPVNELSLEIVNKCSSFEHGGNFQISAGVTDSNYNLTLCCGFFTFKDESKVTNMMFHRITDSSAEWKQSSDNLTLLRPVADSIRDVLMMKVKQYIVANIFEIEDV